MGDHFIISIHNWTEEILQELAEFTFKIWKEKRSEIQLERVVNWFKRLDLKYPPLAITASIGKKIIGWIFFAQMTPSEAEINPWALNGHPIVLPEYENDFTIKQKLIAEAIEIGKSNGLTTIELGYRESDNEINYNYESLDMLLIERNCQMRYELTNQDNNIIDFSENYNVKPIDELDKELLYQCFLETFRSSQDEWMLNKTDNEIHDYYQEIVLESDFPLISSASIGILSNNQIIAFSVVRESHGDKNGHLWIMGVHPNFRHRGLGRKIIHYIKSILNKGGYKNTTLNVSLSNEPALNLYLSEGYEKVWTQACYNWKAKK
ncbi:MAG: GNAT family N-acetyltransferase [Asgard group archaeon]|nr:GNAT family N-acetyltransferase [Asgard group archaeon]